MVASKENGLEVNADKTKCMVMSGDQNAGQNLNIRKLSTKTVVTVRVSGNGVNRS